MPDRRTFMTHAAAAAAGLLCASQSVGQAAQQTPRSGAPARRRVTVGGRRVTAVDTHCHCIVPQLWEVLKDLEVGRAQNTPDSALIVGPDRMRVMDEQGIDVEVLTINPFWYGADRDLARRIIEIQNEGLAAICAKWPDRFRALATVALQHPDLAAEQLEQAVRKWGMRGASTGATVNGEELASPKFEPFWAKVQELDAFVFIHPQGVPQLQSRLQGNGFLTNVIGNPLDTTIALSHLIFEGTLDRFPRLKICAAHAGGYLASYIGRSDRGCLTFPQNCNKALKKRPSEYLRQLYVDSMVFNGEGLRHLVAACGASQVVLGTDYPFPWTSTAVDHVLQAPGLTDADRVAVLGGNLTRLLGIPPVA